MRLPLAPLYLGGLYARLDHFSKHLRIAHGRIPVLAYIDEIFLQLFLFEHFPWFAPMRKLPTILPDKKASLPAWSWGSAYPSRCLEEVIDLEQISASAPIQGSYDFWLLCTSPTSLPGLIVMDRDYPFGDMNCPITYRPERMSRQLGWDQDPKNVELAFYPIEDLMNKVLFQSVLPEYDPSLVVPFDRTDGVTIETGNFLPLLLQTWILSVTNPNLLQRENVMILLLWQNRPSEESCQVPMPRWSEGLLRNHLSPPVDATPPRVSIGSRFHPSLTSKAKGSSTVACSPKSLQSPIKGTSSFPGKIVKRRSPRTLCKIKTIPNTPNDPGVAQDVIQDNPQVEAECENNVDSGVPYEGNSVGSNVEPIQMVLPTTDSQSPFPASDFSNLTKESPVVTSCDSAHDEFEYFHDDAKALLSCFASSNPSFVLPIDLSPLFKRLGYQAFLNSWAFFTAHTFADLWDIHKDMVETHLNNLKLFKFSDSLLEKLSSKLKPPSSRVLDFAREETLSKEYDSISSDVSALQERIDSLTTELNTMKAKLASVSLEREQLAKTKEAASSLMTCEDLL
ncbi:hypothetical protein PIB30_066533 [Stylosanthes scabra]|uniref:Aminotransferase-like plant mobile domain-containing protein n=1 Tax=Stylosanthes scabra TaxID=79078 RepID=A0ABU6SMR6_9FABA|nr:hypothetical protein [Stylosanthes scabra]